MWLVARRGYSSACGCPADMMMDEHVSAAFTVKLKPPHRLFHPRILGVAKVIKDDDRALRESRSPGLYLSNRFLSVVRAIDVEQINKPRPAWALLAQSSHEAYAPPRLWPGQLEVALALTPVKRIVGRPLPRRISQCERDGGPPARSSKLDHAPTLTRRSQQQRKIVGSCPRRQSELIPHLDRESPC